MEGNTGKLIKTDVLPHLLEQTVLPLREEVDALKKQPLSYGLLMKDGKAYIVRK